MDLPKASPSVSKKTSSATLDKSDSTRAKLIINPDHHIIHYPSPYASVQVDEAPQVGTLKTALLLDQPRFVDDKPYATIKRVAKMKNYVQQCDRNLYDYPGKGRLITSSSLDPLSKSANRDAFCFYMYAACLGHVFSSHERECCSDSRHFYE